MNHKYPYPTHLLRIPFFWVFVLVSCLQQTAAAEDLLIKGGTVVTAEGSILADVRVRGEQIREIGNLKPTTGERVLDASDLLVMPGGIDPHVHLVAEPNDNTWIDNFTTGSEAALAGGITTLGLMAFPNPNELPMDTLSREQKAIEAQALVDLFIHVAVVDATEAVVDQLQELASAGQPSIKIFMPYPPFEAQLAGFTRVFSAARQAGMVITIHCEDLPTINRVTEELTKQGNTSLAYYAESRPTEAEEIATHRAIEMANATGATIYIVHLSSESALLAAESARDTGRVFIETRPLYLHLTNAQYEREDRGLFVGMPPLRPKADQDALWEGLASGTIDTIATDHAPYSRAQKLDPKQSITFFRAGVNNLQVMLPMLFSKGVQQGRLSLERFVEVTSTNTAKIFGMYPRKGTIAVGSDADIVLWNPDEVRVIRDDDVLSKAGFSIYSGTEVQGWPVTTIRRGEVVFENGSISAAPGSGKLISRSALAQ